MVMESKAMSEPKSLQEEIIYFANPDNCIDYLAIRRCSNGIVICPTCGSDKVKFSDKRRTWTCAKHHSKREFSIKVGTVMEDSAIPLDKWLTATWLVTNCKNGISSYEIARDVKVTQKSAWFMLHRIRLAMQDDFFGSKVGGETKPLLAAKRGTCTLANASVALSERGLRTRQLLWGSLNAVARIALL